MEGIYALVSSNYRPHLHTRVTGSVILASQLYQNVP